MSQMTLAERLAILVMQSKFKSEREVYFLDQDEDPTELYNHPRLKEITEFRHKSYNYDEQGRDMIYHQTIPIESVIQDAGDRAAVEDYTKGIFPGADSLDMYIALLENMAREFGVGNHDLVFDRIANNPDVTVIDLYEKHGHYFTKRNGAGLDVTPFIEEHRTKVFGFRDSQRIGGYKHYLIAFMDEIEKLRGGNQDG